MNWHGFVEGAPEQRNPAASPSLPLTFSVFGRTAVEIEMKKPVGG